MNEDNYVIQLNNNGRRAVVIVRHPCEACNQAMMATSDLSWANAKQTTICRVRASTTPRVLALEP